jgi:hypothetical protein
VLGPRIDPAGGDDLDHVIRRVDDLLRGAPHLRRAGKNSLQDEFKNLRRDLSQRKDVTWQVLWEQVIDLMVVL